MHRTLEIVVTCEELAIRTRNLAHLSRLLHGIASRRKYPPCDHQNQTPCHNKANRNQKRTEPDNQMRQKFKDHMLR